jgi:protein-arginine kinase activator protein McsA
MIIKQGSVGNTGNSVANYHWQIEVCDTCDRDGKVSAEIDEIKEFIINKFWGEKGIVKAALKLWHQLKKEGRLICPDCKGQHKWEKWY